MSNTQIFHLTSKDRHPETADLTQFLTQSEGADTIVGPHARVYKCELHYESTTKIVAVKRIYPRGATPEDIERVDVRVRREIVVWIGLEHENIVQLLGTTEKNQDFPSIGMVSEWMENGNLWSYIKETRPLIDRLQLICDVVTGLTYLHSQRVIHGDLTSANVLIDNNGRARLVDFGLSSIIAAFEGTSLMASAIGGALRFRAMELMPPLEEDPTNFDPKLTTACDIYSLGSVTLQILSGQQPYYNINDDVLVALALTQRKTPDRPDTQKLVDRNEYWDFIQKCWRKDPVTRPNAEEARDELFRLRKVVLA
ncbi:hypothetical protein HWV62_10569 [Athelia sp. TMB]|nr:hypothetical protein HWV62_10569 [Athelia sp. TMB]